jgi:hypothetical protein
MALITAIVEYAEYEFSEAYAERPGTAIAGTGAATNKLTATAHGLVNGDVVSLTDIVTLTGVAAATRYYVVGKTTNDFQLAATPGGSAIAIGNSGSANVYAITRYRLYFPNKITPNADTNTFEWKGGARVLKLTSLAALTLTLDVACVPPYFHSNVFNKASVVFNDGALAGSNVIGLGGGNDKQGVTTGLYLKCLAKKLVSGAEIGIVTRFYWYPAGTLALTAPRGPESGAVGSLQQYTYSATPGAADINGAAISGMASDDYCLTGELA